MVATRGVTRGDVYWVDLHPRSGSEQRGKRPAIVVSHDSFNEVEAWRSVIVIPLTTSERQARRGPTAVFLKAGEAGLRQESIALCHQVTTIDRKKLVGRLGRISDAALAAVEEGLVLAMDLNRP